MPWNLDDSRPIWPQLKEQLMRYTVSGGYPMGGAFPTVRDLAEQAGVNRNTMQRALSELESEGFSLLTALRGAQSPRMKGLWRTPGKCWPKRT